MTQHDDLGASKAERWMNCPGSNAMCVDAPPEQPSKYAIEGTAAHALAAWLLMGEYFGEVNEPSPLPFMQDGIEIEASDDTDDAVEVYTNFIDSIMVGCHPSWLKVEQRVEIPGIEVWDGEQHTERSLFGTTDTSITIPYTKLVVVDYKHGRGISVGATENPQLLFYGLGTWLALSNEQREGIEVVELVIVQPRCPGAGIDIWKTTPERLLEFYEALKIAAKRVRPGAELNAGSWCKWCPAKPVCPAILKRAGEIARLDFSDVAVPTSAPVLPVKLSGDEIAYILNRRKEVEDWFNAIDGEAHRRILLGEHIPGYKVVESVGNRKWREDADGTAVFAKTLGENGIWAERKLLSPAKMESALKKAKVDPKIVESYTFKPKGKLSLVQDKDARAAATSTSQAKQDYINIETIES